MTEKNAEVTDKSEIAIFYILLVKARESAKFNFQCKQSKRHLAMMGTSGPL